MASPAARAVVTRLDERLASVLNQPPPNEPSEKEPALAELRSVLLSKDGAFLHVRAASGARARLAELRLPLDARGAFHIADERSGLGVDVLLRDTNEAEAEIVDGHVVYRKAAAKGTADLVHRPSAEGTEDFVLFDEPPPTESLSYVLSLGDEVAGLRLVENILELVDEGGAPRLRVAAPYVVDAEGRYHDASLSVEGCAFDANPAAPWGRTPTPPGASECTVKVDWSERGVRYPAVVDPTWTTTQSMQTSRYGHVATLLDSGKVLVAAGYGSNGVYLTSAELFDPSTKTWASTGSLSGARYRPTATLLANGTVLVAGGYANTSGSPSYLASSNVYDPAAGAWTAKGTMNTGRYRHATVALGNTSVLFVGGENASGALASAETYDVSSGTFAFAANMASARSAPVAVQLPNLKVLVAGGWVVSPETWHASAEIYDPAQKTFTSAAPMSTGRSNHEGVRLADGRVLVAGGASGGSTYPTTTDIYDHVTNTWSPGPAALPRSNGTMTLLADGKVLFVGGYDGSYVASAQLFVPSTNQWVTTASLAKGRRYHTATRLPSGDVLVAGGYDPSYLASAEIFYAAKTCTESSDCASGFCVDGYCCDSACDGDCQRCDPPGSEGVCGAREVGDSGRASCAPYACDGTSADCPVSCTNDAQCAAGNGCVAGSCQPKKSLGTTCATDGECASGHCVDGVCCDSACNAVCDRCDITGAKGICSPVAKGSQTQACGPYLCNGIDTDCPTSCTDHADCDGYCQAGQCYPKQSLGSACTYDAACESGFCVDGTCCDSACDGQCARCDAPGSVGTCTAVQGAPVGARPACTSDGSACAGSCDGVNMDSCSYPNAGIACGASSCEEGAFVERACDGKGKCAAKREACAPYACGDSGCLSSCTSEADCSESAECVEGTCKGTLEAGARCTNAGECASGFCEDGVCCQSSCTDACKACNLSGSEGVCAPNPSEPGCESDAGGAGAGIDAPLWEGDVEEGGCGCRVAGKRGQGGAGAGIVMGLAIGMAVMR